MFYLNDVSECLNVDVYVGFYSEGGRDACVECTAGYACPSIYSNFQLVCARGTYSEAGATFCTDCEQGYECENTTTQGMCIYKSTTLQTGIQNLSQYMYR